MRNIELIVLETLIFMFNVLVSRAELCPLDKDFQRSYVGLTLSPIYQNRNNREIYIIWENVNFRTGDKIFLFAYSGEYGFRKLYEVIPTTSHGMDETGIEAHFHEPSLPLFVEQCRKYYVAWIRNGYIREINCLGNQPTWMYDRRDFLGPRKLANLFIPGTHNSGTYKYRQRTTGDKYPRFGFSPSAQDLDVMTQLVQGVRYIHVHVGYHPDNRQTVWWVHKMNLPLVKLDTIIDQVKSFLQYTREIVVFDVQDFPVGFETKQDYIDFMNYTQTRFGAFLPPVEYNLDTPLDSIWNLSGLRYMPKMGKVLLNFNLDDAPYTFPESEHSFIRYKSVNSRNFQDYFEGLSKAEVPKKDMDGNALLRATLVGFKSPFGTTARELAERINPDITIWYHELWYPLANIVALDFFEASGIVDVAIKSNEFRYRYHSRWNKTRAGNCTPPASQFSYSPEYILNNPSTVKLLVPRIVEYAVDKIYSSFPELTMLASTKFDFDY